MIERSKKFIIENFKRIAKIVIAVKLLLIFIGFAYLYYNHSTRNFELLNSKLDSLLAGNHSILLLLEGQNGQQNNNGTVPQEDKPEAKTEECATSELEIPALKFQAVSYLYKIRTKLANDKNYADVLINLDHVMRKLKKETLVSQQMSLLYNYIEQQQGGQMPSIKELCIEDKQPIAKVKEGWAFTWDGLKKKVLELVKVKEIEQLRAEQAAQMTRDGIAKAIARGNFDEAYRLTTDSDGFDACRVVLAERVNVETAIYGITEVMIEDD